MVTATSDSDKRRKTKFQKELGGHIKSWRQRKGVSAAELGRRLDMERSHVSRLESGGTNPSAFLLFRICSVLKISPSEFWEDFKKVPSDN